MGFADRKEEDLFSLDAAAFHRRWHKTLQSSPAAPEWPEGKSGPPETQPCWDLVADNSQF